MSIDSTSPFRILFNDLTPDADLTISSTLAGYSASALGDTDRQTIHKASSAGSSYNIKFWFGAGVSKTVKGIAICNHNLHTLNLQDFKWQRNTGSHASPTWTTEETITKATLGSDDDFFVYSSSADEEYRLLITNTGTWGGYPTIGRVFIAESSFYLADTSHAYPVEGSGAGRIYRGEMFESLTGIEHAIPRGTSKQRPLWAFDRLGTTDSANLKWLSDELEYAETFIISDPESATDRDYGRAVHVRLNSMEFMRSWQVASREACVLDMIEVL